MGDLIVRWSNQVLFTLTPYMLNDYDKNIHFMGMNHLQVLKQISFFFWNNLTLESIDITQKRIEMKHKKLKIMSYF